MWASWFDYVSGGRKSKHPTDLSDNELERTETHLSQSLSKTITSKGGLAVHFFHKELAKARNSVYLAWLKITLALMIVVLGILSLLWAVQFRVLSNIPTLKAFVVDFDGQVAPYTSIQPLVGPTVVQICEEQKLHKEPTLGWEIRPASEFADATAIKQAVYDEHAWAAIVVNANATALLLEAIQTGDTTYDPFGAAQVIYVQARDEGAHRNYISPILNRVEIQIINTFGKKWSKALMQNVTQDSDLAQRLTRVPQAVNPAIGFTTFNLRPFGPPTATLTVGVGLLFLVILSFFTFSFYLDMHRSLLYGEGHPPLHFTHLIVWHFIAEVFAYFFISLAFTLVSLAFKVPLSGHSAPDVMVAENPNPYGKGSFMVLWMLYFVGMCALGLASENMAMIIGMPWASVWLLFWVITNVSTAFYPLALAPGFFQWGYAWPLHNISQGTRTILFGTHSKIGLNFGILFAWTAVGIVLFPFCNYAAKSRSLKAMRVVKVRRQREAQEEIRRTGVKKESEV
ncbi:MAG: hypothetical protein M1814_003894 [Vezdaea aestivalis]|nr:MAG: hypothetical protein M1814_003894 [Vezdaea aestivalis]